MQRAPSDRTGVLIVRLWIEANHQRGLRARITQTLDTMNGERSTAVAASADAICGVVERWVEDFKGSHGSSGEDERNGPGANGGGR